MSINDPAQLRRQSHGVFVERREGERMGQLFVELVGSVAATCRQQGWSILEYLKLEKGLGWPDENSAVQHLTLPSGFVA